MNYNFNWTEGFGGVVFNDKFPDGHTSIDETLKPVLPSTPMYDEINYNEEFGDFYITVNGELSEMTEDQKAEAKAACIAWDDPTLPTAVELLEEKRLIKKGEITATFDMRVRNIDWDVLPHEMVSWRKQEEEARAWDADNNAVTPRIDILLVERGLGETKQELVDKIIANADAYLIIYAELLGRYQKALRLLSEATTEAEIDGVTF